MLDKLANKALLIKSLKESLIKQAAPNPKPWYERAMEHPVGQAAMWGSMLIPATWAPRLIGGAALLARGSQVARGGANLVRTGSALKTTNTAKNVVTRGNQLRRTGAEQMRRGNQMRDKGKQYLGLNRNPAHQVKILQPKTYKNIPRATGNMLTAPLAPGKIGMPLQMTVSYGNYQALKSGVNNMRAGRAPYQNAPPKIPQGPPPAGVQPPVGPTQKSGGSYGKPHLDLSKGQPKPKIVGPGYPVRKIGTKPPPPPKLNTIGGAPPAAPTLKPLK